MTLAALPFHPRIREVRGGRASASEGRSGSDRAERQNAGPGLDCSSNAGRGSPAATGESEDGSSNLLFRFGRQRAVGAELKCPLRTNHPTRSSRTEENQMHKVQSGR